MRIKQSAWLIAGVVGIASCGGGGNNHTTGPSPEYTSVQLSSNSGSAYEFGPAVTMVITAIDQNGHQMSAGGNVPVYHSTSASVSVNASNVVVVTTGTPGNATITADLTIGGVTHSTNGVGLTTDLAPSSGSVNVSGTTFVPLTIDIKAGSNVNWSGLSAGHNVDFGASGATPFTGGTAAVSGTPGSVNTAGGPFPTAGSYAYQCDIHGPAMHGTIVVH